MDRFLGWVTKLVLVFLYVPIVAVVVYSFNASPRTSSWEGLSLRWYVELFGDGPLLKTLQTSLIVGIFAAGLATAIGFLSALALTRYRFKGRAFFLGAIVLPLIIPEIVLGVALLTVFGSSGIKLGVVTLVLGHLIVALPLTTLIMMGSLSSLDPSLPEAATDLGCTPWQTFTRVLFPLTRSAMLASFLLSFTTSFSNIVISTFTSGVGTTTMPLRIYSMLKTGITPEINALGALLILLTLVIIFAVGLQQMRRILVGAEEKDQAPDAAPDTISLQTATTER
ncbi:ABC transporter permease [Homoserinimonas sp. OAct 916]|uniref:ABC transporter permease n=1 Tax=Homoserinimonas sp. OAct 916 TaxID=2211450 RepID=UPI000DBE44B1|nr:ABC transporter permease [Homoserinimonas sp. OAct 916]